MNQVTKAEKKNSSRTPGDVWELRLYVAGQTAKSVTAFANIKRICEEHIRGRYEIEVVDLLKNPRLAKGDQILAIPTLVAAGGYSLFKERKLLSVADLPMFAVGFVVSFIAAWFCVRWLLRYISTHTFVAFAWYRIAFGLVILGTAYAGLVRWE